MQRLLKIQALFHVRQYVNLYLIYAHWLRGQNYEKAEIMCNAGDSRTNFQRFSPYPCHIPALPKN
jgi:hypothetical protein